MYPLAKERTAKAALADGRATDTLRAEFVNALFMVVTE
jgi:hypothetical protein